MNDKDFTGTARQRITAITHASEVRDPQLKRTGNGYKQFGTAFALGAARYLFPLDADHAHLGVPTEVWAKKYSKLDASQVINGLLHEPALVALYHTAEHLDPVEAKSKESEASVRAWKEKRNVLGFFDGRPVQILPPHPEA